MTIVHKCCCGAEGSWEGNTYILFGGGPTEKGFVFLVEKRASEWLELHKSCLAKVRRPSCENS